MSGTDPNSVLDFELAPDLDEQGSIYDIAPEMELAPDILSENDRKSALASALVTNTRLASTVDPAQHASVLNLAGRMQIDPSLVERNPAKIKALSAESDVDIDGIIEHSPVLASWLANYDNMAVSRADIEPLQGLEWWTGRITLTGAPLLMGGLTSDFGRGAFSRALRVGTRQREQSRIGWNLLLSGADPTKSQEVSDLNALLSEDYGKERQGTFGRMAASSLELVGPMVSSFASGAAMGVTAGSAALAAGPGAPVTAPAATGAGILAGMAYDTFEQETGAAYIEIAQEMRDRGVPFNPRTAAVAASVAGTANALLEVGGTKIASVFLPFLGPILGRATKANFGGMTLRKAVTRGVLGYFGTLGEETLTESGQRGFTVLSRESAIGIEGGETRFGGILGEMTSEGAGALEGMALLVLPGASFQFQRNIHESRQGLLSGERLRSLGDIAERINLAKTSPEKLAEFAKDAQESHLAPETVWVSSEAWSNLFRGKGIDPRAAADQIGVRASYDQSSETNGFIAIPFDTYVSKIASNAEYGRALSKDSKFHQESKTSNDAEEHLKLLNVLADEVGVEAAPASKSPIYQERYNELISLVSPSGKRIAEADADHLARLHEAYVRTQIQRTGLTAEELGAVFPLSVRFGDALPSPGVTLNQPGIPDVPGGEDVASIERRIAEVEAARDERYRAEAKRGILPGETEGERLERLGGVLSSSLAEIRALKDSRAWSELSRSQASSDNGAAETERRMDAIRVVISDTVRGWKDDGLSFNESYDRAIALKDDGSINGAQESAYFREIGRAYFPDPEPSGESQIQPQGPSEAEIELDRLMSEQAQSRKPIDRSGGPTPSLGAKESLPQDSRGSITFNKRGAKGDAKFAIDQFLSRYGIEPREFTITLNESSDASTMIHELGHFFLETFFDIAYSDKATDQHRADAESLMSWFGVRTRDDITPEHHELFSKTFESYLESGKSPSLGLVRTFARFSAWLKSIYRKILSAGVPVPADIRSVMDRMIATDEQITNVEESAVYIPMFKNAAEAGMSESAFAAYSEKAEAAHSEAHAALNARILSEQRRETEAWWKEQKDALYAEVSGRINAERQVQAYRYVKDGVIPDDADPAVFADKNGKAFKISLRVIDAEYPGLSRTVRRDMGRSGLAASGGEHPSQIGALFGFPSGSEFLQALVTQDSPDRRIAREVNATMVERHGDILNDGTLPRVAEEVSRESKSRLDQLLQELEGLNRRAGFPRIKITEADLAASAYASIRSGRVRDLDPYSFQQAERTAATNAMKAYKKGKYDEAVEWQRKRLLNYALAREAAKVKKETEGAAKFLSRSDRKPTRAKLGKAGGTYLEQQDKLLERFDFRKRSLRAVDKLTSLSEWVAEQVEQRFDPIIPKKMLDESFLTNWKDMSVQELLDLRDAVKTIQKQADRKNSLIVAGKKRSYEATIAEALSSLGDNVADPGRVEISETLGGPVRDAKSALSSFDAFNVRLEELALQMDGNDPNGIFSQILVHAFVDAQARDKDMGLEIAAEVLKIYEALPKADRVAIQTGTVYVKSIKQNLTMRDVLGIAANYGNDSNYSKLLRGFQTEQGGLIPWTPEAIEEALSHLTEAQWDYIQNVGDILQGLWPQAEALEKRLTGLAPPEIERRPFTRTFAYGRVKTYEGYYYPVIAHPKMSKLLAESMTGPDGGPWDAWHTRATTPHGHLIERTGVAFPLSLNIMRFPSHIAQVVHDITHREAVNEAWRFLTDNELSAELKHRMGLPAYRMMLERVRRIANSRGMLDYDGDWIGAREADIAAALMGWKVTTATQNFANVAIAKQVVGVLPFAAAVNEFRRDTKGTLEFIHASSGEMRHRFFTRDNETRREFERAIVGENWDAAVKRSGYYLASFTNMLTDAPTWLASYRTQMAKDGMTHEGAVRIADSVIRTNFGAGGVKDLALYQDSPLWKHLTMFTGWFSAQYNAQRRIVRETRGRVAEGKYIEAARVFAVEQFWRIAVMAVASEILSGRGPDDSEDAWEWALQKAALYQLSLAPGVKEISTAVDFGTDPRFGGLGVLYKWIADSIKKDKKALQSPTAENISGAFSANAKVLAAAKGWPAAQADITFGYIKDLLTGQEDLGWDTPYRLLFRKQKEQRGRR